MLTYFLWLKVYVVFNNLHNLNILLCECKISFVIGSLTCEIYWETANTSPSVPPTFCGEQRSVPDFEKRGVRKKQVPRET